MKTYTLEKSCSCGNLDLGVFFMEQHPIPQQISSYQFRLVGEMTLKQFFYVAGGAIIGLLIYASGLHPVLKWPLILFSLALGGALAFLPFQERNLSVWIFSFFRSVYAPTIHVWKKAQSNIYFKDDAVAPKDKGVVAPHGEAAMNKYLQKKPGESIAHVSSLENQEKDRLQKISGLLSQTGSAKATPTPTPVEAVQEPVPTIKNEVAVPSSVRPKIVVEEKIAKNTTPDNLKTRSVTPSFTESQESLKNVQTVQFSKDAAPPSLAHIPNTITGQVIDNDGKIVENAILEIKDIAGRSVRALRSNKAGHFITVTALQNGHYEIVTEKEGLAFEPLSFETKGEIIPPIAIKAKEGTKKPTNIDNLQNDKTINQYA